MTKEEYNKVIDLLEKNEFNKAKDLLVETNEWRTWLFNTTKSIEELAEYYRDLLNIEALERKYNIESGELKKNIKDKYNTLIGDLESSIYMTL